MVDWEFSVERSSIKIGNGKLAVAAPSTVEVQRELIQELQRTRNKIKLIDENQLLITEQTPVVLVKHFLNLPGKELEEYFNWWIKSLNPKFEENDPFLQLIPKDWGGIEVDKKIALFVIPVIKASRFSYVFLGDLHLDQNFQAFLFNMIKNAVSTSGNRSIVFWSYRAQIPNTAPFYFKGFSKDAA